MRYFAIICLVLIAISLITAGITLIKDHGSSTRTVRSLTVRIILSVVLFVVLLAVTYFNQG